MISIEKDGSVSVSEFGGKLNQAELLGLGHYLLSLQMTGNIGRLARAQMETGVSMAQIAQALSQLVLQPEPGVSSSEGSEEPALST